MCVCARARMYVIMPRMFLRTRWCVCEWIQVSRRSNQDSPEGFSRIRILMRHWNPPSARTPYPSNHPFTSPHPFSCLPSPSAPCLRQTRAVLTGDPGLNYGSHQWRWTKAWSDVTKPQEFRKGIGAGSFVCNCRRWLCSVTRSDKKFQVPYWPLRFRRCYLAPELKETFREDRYQQQWRARSSANRSVQ